jgi:hypothetical protein
MSKIASFHYRTTVAWAALGMMLLVGAGSARGQVVQCGSLEDYPCAIQLEEVSLQSVPEVFQFQARVSQAKLPLGEGVFNTVYVKIIGPTGTLCMEQFSNVEVHGSVLNLSIGQNMSCELHEVIAEHEDLAFQICLGSPENCLKAIDLGTVPYAVKANFAKVAQNAHQANQAAVAHYAHRLTADRQLWLTKKLGTGYFDFYTDPSKGQDWMAPGWEDGGFILWTPTRNPEGGKTVRVMARNHTDGALEDLDLLVLRSQEVTLSGNLSVAGDAAVAGDGSIGGRLEVVEGVAVTAGGLSTAGDADINGHTRLAQSLTVGDGVTVTAGGAKVLGGGLTVAGGAQVSGGMNITGQVKFLDLVVFEGGTMDTGAQAQFDELYLWTTGEKRDVTFLGTMTFEGPTVLVGETAVEGDLALLGNTVVAGPTVVQGQLTLEGATTLAGSTLSFLDPATLDVDDQAFIRWEEFGPNNYRLRFEAGNDAQDHFWFNSTGGSYFETQARFRGGIGNDTGPLLVTVDLNMNGNIYNQYGPLVLDDNVIINSYLNVKGNIYNEIGNLVIDDALDVNGFLNAKSDLGVYKIYGPNKTSGNSSYIDIMGSAQFYANSSFKEYVNFDKEVTGLQAVVTACDWACSSCQDECWGQGTNCLDRMNVECPSGKLMMAHHFDGCGGNNMKACSLCCLIEVR